MNATEEIVRFYLNTHGYFTMDSIRLPKNREIDILAINLEGKKLHVEVQVSVRFANYTDSAEKIARDFWEHKFEAVKDEVINRLGPDYERLLIIGEVTYKNKDISVEFMDECEKLGIQVNLFKHTLQIVSESLGTHTYLNPVIKAVQLMKQFSEKDYMNSKSVMMPDQASMPHYSICNKIKYVGRCDKPSPVSHSSLVNEEIFSHFLDALDLCRIVCE